MGAGRPRKPKELHEIEGTYRADRHGFESIQGDVLPTVPPPPKILSKLAKKEWNIVCAWLCERGILASTDLSLVAIYCNEVATYFECEQYVKKHGMTEDICKVIPAKKEGDDDKVIVTKVVVRPEVVRQREAAKLALQYAGQFGYTPSARMKLNLTKVKVATGLQKLKESANKPKPPKGGTIEI